MDTQRFILQPSANVADGLVVTDKENGIVCRFIRHRFNETQEFTVLADMKRPDPLHLARIVREIADWLIAYHYDLAMPDHLPPRIRLGKQITYCREQANLTQEELAALSDLTLRNVISVEYGKYNVPIDVIDKICRALDLDFTLQPSLLTHNPYTTMDNDILRHLDAMCIVPTELAIVSTEEIPNEDALFVVFTFDGREQTAIYYPSDDELFTPTDWQSGRPESIEEIERYDWMSSSGDFAVVVNGLPRLF